MKVLFVASECTPFAKVGGLGDVIGALPQALVAEGIEASVILPLYKNLLNTQTELVLMHGQHTFEVYFEGKSSVCELHKTTFHNSPIVLYLVKNEEYLSNGGIYLSDDAMVVGNDEPRRFMFFCRAVHRLLQSGVLQAEVVHSHDWHTSFLLKLIHQDLDLKHIRTVLSVHNLANKGTVSDDVLNKEIDGTVNTHRLMAVGVDAADAIVPVSKNYAKELLRGEFCDGLEYVVEENCKKFTGITNGIDTLYFDPSKDPFLVHTYSARDWEEGKLHAKTELFKKEGWSDTDPHSVLLFGFVGRIALQKNIGLIVDSLSSLSNHALRFIFLGVGEKELTHRLHALALKHNNRIKFINRFDESYARLIYAGSDVFLVPSLYEPCGLTQMIAMRYGALPIGRSVGGLVDTIDDSDESQNGFLFEESTPTEFQDVLNYVFDEWHDKPDYWHKLVINAMTRDFSWGNAAKEYIKIYKNMK